MAAPHSISPTDKAIRAYHQQLAGYQQYSDREGALSNAFFELHLLRFESKAHRIPV